MDQPSHETLAKNTIHTQAVKRHLATIPNSSILNKPPPEIDKTDTEIQRQTRRLLAQLRANKSPFLLSYLNHINPNNRPTPSCPLCREAEPNTIHLFKLYPRTHRSGPGRSMVEPGRGGSLA